MRGVTLKQIAAQYGVAPNTARQWRAQNYFPNAQLKETPFGKIWVVPKSDLRKFKPPVMGRPRTKRG